MLQSAVVLLAGIARLIEFKKEPEAKQPKPIPEAQLSAER